MPLNIFLDPMSGPSMDRETRENLQLGGPSEFSNAPSGTYVLRIESRQKAVKCGERWRGRRGSNPRPPT